VINWHTVLFLLFALVTCTFAVAVVASNNIVRMAFYLIISLGATAGLFFLADAPFVGAMQLMIYVGGTLVLLVFGVMLTAQGPFVSMRTSGGEWVLGVIVGGSLLALLLQAAFSVDAWRAAPLPNPWGATVAANGLEGTVIVQAKQPNRPGGEPWEGTVIRFQSEPESGESLVFYPEGGKPLPTAAEWVAFLNQDPRFSEHLIASLPEGSSGSAPVADGDQVRLARRYPRTDERASGIGLALLGARPDAGGAGRDGNTGYLLPFEIVSVHLLVVLVGAAYLARTKKRVTSDGRTAAD